jgi:two-component system NtrC family sensor kinase
VEAERDALRIRGIVEHLSRLTIATDATSVQPVDVHQSLEIALGMFAKSIISQRIHVVKEFTSHLPSISGRPSDLQQLFMQLIANARDAMPEGGTLILRTDIIEQRLLKVTVQDTGPGIAPRDRERIFDPFFTTHASRGQKGMGLTIAYRIAEEHGGRLSVDTTLGKGCAFRIILPVALKDISSSFPPAPVELS